MTDIDESEILEDIEEMPKPKLIKSKMVKPKDGGSAPHTDTKARFGNVVSDDDDEETVEKPKPPRTPKID